RRCGRCQPAFINSTALSAENIVVVGMEFDPSPGYAERTGHPRRRETYNTFSLVECFPGQATVCSACHYRLCWLTNSASPVPSVSTSNDKSYFLVSPGSKYISLPSSRALDCPTGRLVAGSRPVTYSFFPQCSQLLSNGNWLLLNSSFKASRKRSLYMPQRQCPASSAWGSMKATASPPALCSSSGAGQV